MAWHHSLAPSYLTLVNVNRSREISLTTQKTIATLDTPYLPRKIVGIYTGTTVCWLNQC